MLRRTNVQNTARLFEPWPQRSSLGRKSVRAFRRTTTLILHVNAQPWRKNSLILRVNYQSLLWVMAGERMYPAVDARILPISSINWA